MRWTSLLLLEAQERFINPSSITYVPGRLLNKRGQGGEAKIPGLPFFNDPSHTVPTRRLYRHLLRAFHRSPICLTLDDGQSTPTIKLEGLREKIKKDWRKSRSFTSIPLTLNFLSSQEVLLSKLLSPSPSPYPSSSSSSSPNDYSSLLSLNDKLQSKSLHDKFRRFKSLALHPKGYIRPIRITGGYMRPTFFNNPLPRLKPQPLKLSMIINNRIKSRQRRVEKSRELLEYKNDYFVEFGFYKSLMIPSSSSSSSSSSDPAISSSSSSSTLSASTSASPSSPEWNSSLQISTANSKDSELPSNTGLVSRWKGKGKGKFKSSEFSQGVIDNKEWVVGWIQDLDEGINYLNEQFQKEAQRKNMKFSDAVMKRVERAKKRREEYRRVMAKKRKKAEKRAAMIEGK